MKTKSLFTLAFATLAFAACSNDDAPVNGGDQTKGEIVEAINVRFVNKGSATRAYEGVENGLTEENKLYHAFVFAKEAAPTHTGARTGDWSVQEVGSAASTTPISAGTSAGQLGNMATFKGVRQGDNVYVLANYPDLDLAEAQVLSRKGEDSEASIKAFIATVQKDYLNKLAFSSEEKGTPVAGSKYIMAGSATIPVSPSIANGTTVIVPVKLDREMAKVFFQASVTKDVQYSAAGKVEFRDGDGIIVARVPQKVSPFTTQERDWYFPTPAVDADKDWNPTWLTVFNGNTQSADDNAATIAPFFNDALFASTAKEYRYAWILDSQSGGSELRMRESEGWLISPNFYVTPNYSDNAATTTVISTQATYVGAPEFENPDAQTLFVKGFSKYIDGSQAGEFLDKDGVKATSFSKCVWEDADMVAMNKKLAAISSTGDKEALAKDCGWESAENKGVDKVDAAIAILAKVTKVKAITPSIDDAMIAELSYYDGMKLFYRADIANYDDTNTISLKNTERNTYYKIRATITTLGAKSIEDAINSDDISMQVEVEVNPWNVVFNDVNM